MSDTDPFYLNIAGVTNLVESDTNKINDSANDEEGVTSDFIDELELPKSDEELLSLKKGWENKSAPYMGKIEPRQKANKTYLLGTQSQVGGIGKVVPSNLLFQATATFVPQALAQNPEPQVWSDNTDEGIAASNDIKTMLQFHADILCLRKKLGVMVWQWGVYLIAVIKHGWNQELNDIDSQVRRPSNFIFDPDGYIDEYGDYIGEYLGERIQCSAQELIDLYGHEEYIREKVHGKMGTQVTRTEWWTNEYCFTTFEDEILDKHKNEFFNYKKDKPNHFAKPKMPYTFLSIFSLQEQPHDFTNLIEQNIPNQDMINQRDYQISKNLAHSNNAILMDETYFTIETAHQGAEAIEKGDPILAKKGSVERLPANQLPSGILEAQDKAKEALQGIYGTLGLSSQPANEDQTARGMILNQSHDSSRIGGGVGDALEQVADNIFNWWLQLYYVFYDEKHYAAIMGTGRAVQYVALTMSDEQRRFVVSVAPNSMKPKDELSEINNAIALWEAKALDPLTLFQKLNYPDPHETAKKVSLWITNPQLYISQNFPDVVQQPLNSANPPVGQAPPQAGTPPTTLSSEPASAQLSQVPLPK